MKYLILLLLSMNAYAGYSVNNDQIFNQGFVNTNFVINPSAEKNITLGITSTITGSFTRTTTNPLGGISDFTIDAAASGEAVKWSLNPLTYNLKGQNCEARATFTGDASLYTFNLISGATVLTTVTMTSETSSKDVSLNYTCGDLSDTRYIQINSTSASATAIRVAKVYYGLATNLYSSTVIRAENANTDWVSFSPTIGASTTPPTAEATAGKWRRVGDSMEIEWYFRIDTIGSGIYRFPIPSGYTIDTAKLANAYGIKNGGAKFFDASTGNNYLLQPRFDGALTTQITFTGDGGANIFGTGFSSVIPAKSDEFYGAVTVPITGWTNNQNAPLLVGSVTSGTTELIRHESAKIRCSSSSSITDQLSASWIASVGNISSGACSVTLTTGYFSTTPICQLSVKSVVGSGYFLFVNPTSTTAVTIGCNIMTSGSATLANCTNEDLFLTCDGLR